MKNKVEFDQATKLDYFEFFSDRIPAHVMRVDGVPVAIAGFHRHQGELVAFLEVKGRPKGRHLAQMILMMRRALPNMDAPVIAHCDSFSYPKAPRLLRTLGFKKTDRIENGMEIWQWQS